MKKEEKKRVMENRQIKKKVVLSFLLYILLLLFIDKCYAQECNNNNTPVIKYFSKFELNEGEPFEYKFDILNQLTNELGEISFSLIPINATPAAIKNISIDKISGLLKFKPANEEKGIQTFFVIATTSQGCYDIKKIELIIYDKPKILNISPSKSYIEVDETDYLRFSINATTSLPNNNLLIEWYHNNKKVKTSSNFFTLFTNFSDSGKHYIEVVVSDLRGLNSSFEWEINIKNINRPPYLKYNFPDFVLTNETKGELFNINNYIYDPDLDKLKFEAFFVEEFNPEIIKNQSKVFDIFIDKFGSFYISPQINIYLKEYVRINASDSENYSILSNPFMLKLASSENITVLFINYSKKEECKVEIQCREWSLCLPTNIRTRECFDINDCNGENKSLLESEKCEYNATCFDKIKNQNEEGVDCGGVCDPCPTCEDEILNQGEEGVDCGGPCSPCPSCNDGILNQDETDIDCGGKCSLCDSGKSCLLHKDCISFNCINSICALATCDDSKKNQGEEKVDCGGPCSLCPTCNDKIQNQGEEGVDCGGPCKPCPSCFDKIKNQGETFVDCGGPCKQCGIIKFFGDNKLYLFLSGLFIIFIVAIVFVKLVYFRNELISISNLSKFFKFLPATLPDNYQEIIIKTINQLNETKQKAYNSEDKQKIVTDLNNIINSFFSQLFEIEGTFSKGSLKATIRQKIKNPFLLELFMKVYTFSLNVNPETPLFKIDFIQKVDELIKIINLIRETI